jgi:GT2 family glycosyltransferase
MLEELVRSLSEQTYADIDVVLYNAGTREETRRVLGRIKDPSFRVIHGAENLGISGTRTPPSGKPGANTSPCATTTT